VHAAVIQKGTHRGGAAGFAQYIAREEPDQATQCDRYLDPEGGRDDLVAKGSGGLPAWATAAHHFWQMADQYERGGAKRPGTVARTYEIALPRELSPDARGELAADIRETFFARYPHSWALHNPRDPEGGEHPHLHLMVSERGPSDGVPRDAQRFFSQAAGPQQDPARHGVRKDRSWQGPTRLRELRAGIATLTNAALERAGVDAAVTHTSLRGRGLTREAAVYTTGQDKAAVETRREALYGRWGAHRFENEENLVAWRAQKARDGIRDLSRDAMVDHVRDRFWRHDTSPARQQERDASVWRTLHREHERTGRPLQGPRQQRARVPLAQARAQLQAALARLGQDEHGHGTPLHVRLHDRERDERERGMGW